MPTAHVVDMCLHVSMCECVRRYVYVCVFMYVCDQLVTHFTCCLCVLASMCVCVRRYVYVCVFMYVCTQLTLDSWPILHAVFVYWRVCACVPQVYVCVHVYVRLYPTYPRLLTHFTFFFCVLEYACAYTQVCEYVCVYTYIYLTYSWHETTSYVFGVLVYDVICMLIYMYV